MQAPSDPSHTLPAVSTTAQAARAAGDRQEPASPGPHPPGDRGHRVQAQVLGVGARLRLVGRQAARALHACCTSSSAASSASTTISQYYPLVAADRDRALHVLRRRDVAGHDLDRRQRDARAQALVPAARSSRSPRPLTAAITFGVNASRRRRLRRLERIAPQLDWLLLVPLLLELYVFVARRLARSSRRSSCFLRDIGQVWELALQLIFYATPIIYPVGFLPPWARDIAFLNPFTQILQDVRAIVLYPDLRRTGSPRRTRSRPAGCCPIAIAFGDLRRRPAALPPLRAVVRGARMTAGRRGRGARRLEDLPAAAPAADDVQGALPAPVPADDVRAPAGARRHHPSRSRTASSSGSSAPNGSGKSTLLKILAGIYRAGRGRGAGPRHALAVHRARRRLQPRALRPRQHRDQRRRCSASRSASSRSASTRSSRSPSSSASSTRS